MISKTNRKMERTRRHIRVRTKISGTSECPRLCVYRSNTNIYAQIVDDTKGITLVSASTLDKEIKEKHSNIEAAKEVGALIAKRAIEKNIKNVVYDRGRIYLSWCSKRISRICEKWRIGILITNINGK